ncbi:hypothetical protein WI89_23605 [Burkholderia ubonensis]|nr:hypothetical protein WI89_23605 [Burkholderia ubonensis]
MSVPIFDVHHTVKKQPGRGYRDEEDEALTFWVTALWKELHSRDETPLPPCPRCESEDVRLLNRATPRRPFPLFHCRECNRMYSRISGSPLQRLRHPWKIPDFIRLLSQPISLDEAGRRMGMEYPAVSNWLMRFRELMALHDPDGTWLARVRLGVKYRPVGVCARCGYEGTFHYGGFTPENRRRVICPACKRTWMIDDGADHYVEMRLTVDPSQTAARRVRKAGRAALDLPAAESGLMVVTGRARKSSRIPPNLSRQTLRERTNDSSLTKHDSNGADTAQDLGEEEGAMR